MQYYSFQLHIRGILNDAQVLLYGEGTSLPTCIVHRFCD